MRWTRWWPVIPALVVFLWCGFRGLDFGEHWDERLFVLPLKRFAQGSLMPGAYNYPSLAYYLSYLAAIPNLLSALGSEGGFWREFSSLETEVDQTYFRFRIRAIYLVITSATLFFVYDTALASGRRMGAAVVAMMAVAASYEVSYHSRWFAPDGPLLTFSAFTIWALVRSERAENYASARRALAWAAVGAALATGTKYTAGLYLFVVVGLAVVLHRRFTADAGPWWRTIGIPFGVYTVTYLLTTPATLLDTKTMLQHIEDQRRVYGGGFFNYTVDRGFDHLSRMILYLGGELFSPYVALSVALAIVGAIGVAYMVRTQWTMSLVVLATPVMFIAVFTSQKTMIVRNLLVLLPAFALAIGWGYDALAGTGSVWRRVAATALVGSIFAVNLGFNLWAAESVKHRRSNERFAVEAAEYLRGLKGEKVYVTMAVQHRLRSAKAVDVVSTAGPRSADWLMFFTHEGFEDRGRYPANYWQMTEAIFGPHEVNFDRYPTFFGPSKILLMRRSVGEDIGLRLFPPKPQ